MTPLAPIPVFDGHNDTLLRLHTAEPDEHDNLFDSQHGHIDLKRAHSGHFIGGFFAVFCRREPDQESPDDELALPPPLSWGYSQREVLAMFANLSRLEHESGGAIQTVRTVAEIEACMAAGQVAAIMHIEGAEAIDAELDALELFYRAGLRSIGPVWSRANIFGHGVPFAFGHTPDIGPGLSEAGIRLIKTCNQRRIMVDLSHLNEAGFWDVAKHSQAPLVATHSNVHAICPSPRNLTDRQLDAIRDSDGMVGLNFHCGFLRPDGKGDPDTPLSILGDHIDYLVQKLGLERVGLGSDYDGAVMPNDVGDVSKLQNLFEHLRTRGYDQPALEQLGYKNWLRVLRLTWGQ